MGLNLKEEWQKANKKNVAIIVGIVLVLLLGTIGGLSAYKTYAIKKEKAKLEETIKNSYDSIPYDLNGEPKKPSEYNIGIDYNKAVRENKPILTLFYADWCGYCIKFMPIYQELSEKYKDEVNFSKINVEDAKFEKLVKEMRLTGFPTLFIIDPKYDNQVLISNSFMGSTEDVSIEIDRFLKIRKRLDSKK